MDNTQDQDLVGALTVLTGSGLVSRREAVTVDLRTRRPDLPQEWADIAATALDLADAGRARANAPIDLIDLLYQLGLDWALPPAEQLR